MVFFLLFGNTNLSLVGTCRDGEHFQDFLELHKMAMTEENGVLANYANV